MKIYKQLTICRAEMGNRPTIVRAVIEADMIYQFEVAPELTDRRIVALTGRLIDREEYESNNGKERKK